MNVFTVTGQPGPVRRATADGVAGRLRPAGVCTSHVHAGRPVAVSGDVGGRS